MQKLTKWFNLFRSIERIEALADLTNSQLSLVRKRLSEIGEQMSADANAINSQLTQLDTKLDKIAAEVAAIKPGMTPEETSAIKARITALIGKADAIDELNPDAPPVA